MAKRDMDRARHEQGAATTAVHQWVARIRREGERMSRNKNFELYQNPTARRALRLHHLLLRLERDLLRHAGRSTVRLLPPPSGSSRAVLELTIPHLRLVRRVFLEPEELHLLRESSEIAELLPVPP
jgi:hypothetical protein